MSADPLFLLGLLARASAALSLVLLGVIGLRLPLRRRYGAAAAYAAWGLVPLLLAAALLPASPTGQALQVLLPWQATLPAAAALPAAPGSAWPPLLLAAWLLGVAAHAAALLLRQRRFMATLRREGTHWVGPAGSGPALVGLWPARLCLPADFEQRFPPEERALILAHEAVHRRRGDNAWNLLAAAVCGLQWFNPLAWWAQALMRADQELSCDAAVLRAHADEAPRYARALVAAQQPQAFSAAAGLPWSSWQSPHPLVERIAMLNRHPHARRRAGLRTLALLALLGAGAVHALQSAGAAAEGQVEAPEGKVRLDFKLEVREQGPDGSQMRSTQSSIVVAAGRMLRVGFPAEGAAEPTEVSFQVTAQGGDRWEVATALLRGDPQTTVAKPRLITQDGVRARIEMGAKGGLALKFDITPTRVPQDTPLGVVR